MKHIVNIRDANTFHNRVINTWNKLPDSIVLAPSISCFKRRLSTFVCNVSYDYFFTQSVVLIFIFYLCTVCL